MGERRRLNYTGIVGIEHFDLPGGSFKINPYKMLFLGLVEDAHLDLGKLITLRLNPSFPKDFLGFCRFLSVDLEKDDFVKIESARKLHLDLSQLCLHVGMNQKPVLEDCFLLLYREEWLTKDPAPLLKVIGNVLAKAIQDFKPFGLLALPRSLHPDLLEKYAQLAFQYKLHFLTDLDNISDVLKLDTQQEFWSSTSVFWNPVKIPRPTIYERHSFFLSPMVAALRGILRKKISQPAAGIKHGHILGTPSTKWPNVTLSEVAELDKNGIIPLITREEQVYCFGDRTLYSGKDTALLSYPNVRLLRFVEQALELYLKLYSEKLHQISNWIYLENILKDFFRKLQEAEVILRGEVSFLQEEASINYKLEIGIFWRILDVHYDLIIGEDKSIQLSRTQ